MSKFTGKRVAHEYVQTNVAAPEIVFPLLCPVEEEKWVPGWEYRLIYSKSGVAELGCVFTTPNEDGGESTWMTTEYDPGNFRIAYVWVRPGVVTAHLQIELARKGESETAARIRFTYTGLSEEGNRVVDRYDQAWFQSKMTGWETAINHYLETGRLLGSPAWE